MAVQGGGVAEAALLNRKRLGRRALVSLRCPYRNLHGTEKFVPAKSLPGDRGAAQLARARGNNQDRTGANGKGRQQKVVVHTMIHRGSRCGSLNLSARVDWVTRAASLRQSGHRFDFDQELITYQTVDHEQGVGRIVAVGENVREDLVSPFDEALH